MRTPSDWCPGHLVRYCQINAFTGIKTITFVCAGTPLHSFFGLTKDLFTPGGLRGGGAVHSYLQGRPISDIQWDLRLANQTTLTHYIQETAAINSLVGLDEVCRERLRLCSRFYPLMINIIC